MVLPCAVNSTFSTKRCCELPEKSAKYAEIELGCGRHGRLQMSGIFARKLGILVLASISMSTPRSAVGVT
jgi:hypothetical protein